MLKAKQIRTVAILILLLMPIMAEAAAKKNVSNQTRLVNFAKTFLGKKTYSKTIVRDRTFTLDCIGFVSAVYYGIGIDIKKDFVKYAGNEVSRLFQSLKFKKMIYRDRLPAVGDVI